MYALFLGNIIILHHNQGNVSKQPCVVSRILYVANLPLRCFYSRRSTTLVCYISMGMWLVKRFYVLQI